METEIVDDEEFAAIELALKAASTIRGKVSPQSNQQISNQHQLSSFSNSVQQGQNGLSNRSGTIDAFFASSLKPGNATNANQQQQPNQQNRQYAQNQAQASASDPKSANSPRTIVTFQLVKNRRISAMTSTFNQRVIDIFKSCKDKAYDPVTREWSFGVDSHDDVIKQLKTVSNVEIKPLPSFVLRALARQPATAGASMNGILPDDALERLPVLIKVIGLPSISPFLIRGSI